ncbi:MAG: pyridoxal-phosphate dependent enzyme [Aquidulcibacter sp.]|uniref:pyridoxal-phosphate dependent enzyme n=1 Tax=Aquidulcibacter sp. TaxID=2052990 RepID=UPI0022BB2857|nr:pyridoxal-phosphate dependent enzyme [Aquidulcibacter sp.]
MIFQDLHINTPLVEVGNWHKAHQKPALFKMDALQPCGSFKIRGIGRLCTKAVLGHGATSIVCASGGNAGYAAAWAGRELGVGVTVVVPESTLIETQQAIKAVGAEVITHGKSFDDAHVLACSIAQSKGAVYVHPFDHPLLWQGHATLIDEVVGAGADFDCVVTSVGGGGLMLGILEGLRKNGLANTPIIAIETHGTASLNASLAAGHLVTLPEVKSIATSLAAKTIAPAAFAAAVECNIISLQVSDSEAVAGCLAMADRYRILVEPACGAAVAALDVHSDVLAQFQRPLVVVCGGIGVSLERLTKWSTLAMD